LTSAFDGSVELRVLGHFRYADRCLGQFVQNLAPHLTAPLFVITGDHYGRRFPNAHPSLYERMAVPLVLYGPNVLAGRSAGANAVGSHVDIGPTVVNLSAPAGFTYD